jgi:hypothetical protein
MKNIQIFCVAVVSSGLVHAPIAQAQYIPAPSGFYIPIPIGRADQHIGDSPGYSDDLNAPTARIDENKIVTPPSAEPGSRSRQTLSFRVSMAARQRHIDRFISRLRATDSASAEQWEQMFATNDVFGQIDQVLSRAGLSSTNLADAYTTYWISAWLSAQGRNDDISRQQRLVVRDQIAQALLATPQVAGANDLQKQEIAEGLLIQAALIDATIEQVQSNPALMRQTQQAIKQGAQSMGLNLDQLMLTDQGFELRSRRE